MTKRQMFELIAKLNVDNSQIVDFCNHEIELLEKKRSNGDAKANEKIDKNTELVYDALVKIGRATATDLIAKADLSALANDNKIVTTQKVSAYLKKLVDSGRVDKVVEKKKPYFFIKEN